MYGLALLLTVIGMIVWEKWRERPTNARLAAFSAIMLLLVYTHLFGCLIVMAFVVVNWIYGNRRIVFTAAAAVVGLAMLPWVLFVLPVYEGRGLEPNVAWVTRYPINGVAMLSTFFLGPFPFPIPRILDALMGTVLYVLLFVLAWKAIKRLWPPRVAATPAERWFWAGLVIVVVPVVVLFLFSVAVTPAFHPRFIFGIMPSYWLVLALLGQFGGRAARGVLYGAFIPLVLISAGGILVAQRKPTEVRQAGTILSQEARPDDLILCNGRSGGSELRWDWQRRLGRSSRLEILALPPPAGVNPGPPEVRLEGLNLDGIGRVWVFYDLSDLSAYSMDQLTEVLSAHKFKFEKRQVGPGRTLLLFVKTPTP
jgi:hypothetical protein